LAHLTPNLDFDPVKNRQNGLFSKSDIEVRRKPVPANSKSGRNKPISEKRGPPPPPPPPPPHKKKKKTKKKIHPVQHSASLSVPALL